MGKQFAGMLAIGSFIAVATIGTLRLSKTFFPIATTGSQTVTTQCARVNFAAAQTVLYVTSTLFTHGSSLVLATMADTDATTTNVVVTSTVNGVFSFRPVGGAPAAPLEVNYCLIP